MNTGKKWFIEEENRLLNELASDKTIVEIALLHERTRGAISSRRRHIAARFYRDGMPEDEIMRQCRLTNMDL